jgi:hypothetical protein
MAQMRRWAFFGNIQFHQQRNLNLRSTFTLYTLLHGSVCKSTSAKAVSKKLMKLTHGLRKEGVKDYVPTVLKKLL